MGTYTQLEVAGYALFSTKSAVDPSLMTVFRERDKRVFERRLSERSRLYWGDQFADVEEVEQAVLYSCRVRDACDRLDAMGFTLERAKRDFDLLCAREAETYESWAADADRDEWAETCSHLGRFFRRLTYEDYAVALGEVLREGGISSLDRFYAPDGYTQSAIKEYVRAQHDYDEMYMGFFCTDHRSLLRVACARSDPDETVDQDITDLCEQGYYNVADEVCRDAIDSLSAQIPENAPVIVLTEGSSDRSILSSALELIHPHLVGYFTFLDFESVRAQGGAAHLVALVKAFAGAGVANRIIAVFDNDTAAADARRTLDGLDLPENVAVVAYPATELLRAYPTLGPGGTTVMDVNGLAGSIEMYLGRDVLAGEEGLTPVQWRGLVAGVGRYQGEVLHKRRLQRAFRDKVARCRSDTSQFASADWGDMRALLDCILTAFRK